LCGIETCFDDGTAECVTDGYVCQNDFICVPGCEDWGCEDVGLTCGTDGLCYQAEMCEEDADCDSPFNTCLYNVTGLLFDTGDELPVTSSVCVTTCETDDDCDEDFFPWPVCRNMTDMDLDFGGADITGLCQSDPDFGGLVNDTGLSNTCSDDSDCEDPTPLCLSLTDIQNDELDLPDGLCVANDTSLLYNISGLTGCDDDDDCPDSEPVCVDETSDLSGLAGNELGYGTCLPLCNDDADCEGMGFENGFCEDTVEGYGTCVTLDPCDLLSSASDCNSDQVCVNDLCFGECETDDDCSDGVPCEEVSNLLDGVPILEDIGTLSFSYCNVLDGTTTTPAPTTTDTDTDTDTETTTDTDTDTDTETTTDTDTDTDGTPTTSPVMVPSKAPSAAPTETDVSNTSGAASTALFGLVLVVLSAVAMF